MDQYITVFFFNSETKQYIMYRWRPKVPFTIFDIYEKFPLKIEGKSVFLLGLGIWEQRMQGINQSLRKEGLGVWQNGDKRGIRGKTKEWESP